jgi:hypothetical protein
MIFADFTSRKSQGLSGIFIRETSMVWSDPAIFNETYRQGPTPYSQALCFFLLFVAITTSSQVRSASGLQQFQNSPPNSSQVTPLIFRKIFRFPELSRGLVQLFAEFSHR